MATIYHVTAHNPANNRTLSIIADGAKALAELQIELDGEGFILEHKRDHAFTYGEDAAAKIRERLI